MLASIPRHLVAQMDTIRHSPFKRHMGMLLSSCFPVIFLVLCSSVMTISQASADTLSVSIKIQDQYTTASMVTLSASFAQGDEEVGLAGNLKLVCNGIVVHQNRYSSYSSITLPRQPAGGFYLCFYTDEHGTRTALHVPIPPGMLAIISPTSGATIPIPGGAQPTPASPTPGPRPPERVGTLTIRYSVPTFPAGTRTQASATAVCGSVNLHECGYVSSLVAPETGTYLLTDADIGYGYGFETFTPGASGEILLFSQFSWSPRLAGFTQYALNMMIRSAFRFFGADKRPQRGGLGKRSWRNCQALTWSIVGLSRSRKSPPHRRLNPRRFRVTFAWPWHFWSASTTRQKKCWSTCGRENGRQMLTTHSHPLA